jgi:hypothetical protein
MSDERRARSDAMASPPGPPQTLTRVPEVEERLGPLGRWLMAGGSPEEASHAHAAARPWYLVLWLTGVDYFSTLGYQPGIALIAAGILSPVATAVLVIVTLFGALPVYAQVARRSYTGQGSIAMLERLLTGWKSKLFVLALLGFAATDFVITMTLSAADAAKHVVENPYLVPILGHSQLWVTLGLLALLAAVFLRGFGEAIGVGVVVGLPYILLNLVVLARGSLEIARRPELLSRWSEALTAHGSWADILLAAGIVFPQLALGLSGFETGVAVMPLVKGDPADASAPVPWGRIRNTRKMLATAALMMSFLLMATSVVSTLLVPPEAYRLHGPDAGRVLSYLAHELLGNVVGTVYDISTILILWFAGASAMAGLLNLIPRYLPRLGMAPRWVAYARPLVLVLFAIDVLVTLIFRANVEAQGGAYATGVLALIFSAAVAVTLALWHEGRSGEADGVPSAPGSLRPGPRREGRPRRWTWSGIYFGVVAAVFAYTLVQNIHERPDGAIIASIFIVTIALLSALSRYSRATELRVESVTFADAESEALWREIVGKKVNLVPLKYYDAEAIKRKAAEIQQYYTVRGPLAFLHVHLRDDRSDFASVLRVKVSPWEDGNFLIEVHGAVALANAIAYISELLDPISLFLGLTRQNSVSQAIRYLLWGEGETGILVYEILLKHWERTPEEDVRPLIFLMSE